MIIRLLIWRWLAGVINIVITNHQGQVSDTFQKKLKLETSLSIHHVRIDHIKVDLKRIQLNQLLPVDERNERRGRWFGKMTCAARAKVYMFLFRWLKHEMIMMPQQQKDDQDTNLFQLISKGIFNWIATLSSSSIALVAPLPDYTWNDWCRCSLNKK